MPFRGKEHKVKLGFGVFNLFNHFNPRDVQNDLDSYRFGDFFNGPSARFRGSSSSGSRRAQDYGRHTERSSMKKVNQCLILAAGNGTRIRSVSGGLPKPLVQFRGKPILDHVITRAQEAGIDKFVIVVGYRSDLIRRWFDRRWLGKISITWVENPDYHKANGISVLKAKNEIHEQFLVADGGSHL